MTATHQFILLSNNRVMACGDNTYGQLGIGNTTNQSTFIEVTGEYANEITQICCRKNGTFVLKRDGMVKVCGDNGTGLNIGMLGHATVGAIANLSNISMPLDNGRSPIVTNMSCHDEHAVFILYYAASGVNPAKYDLAIITTADTDGRAGFSPAPYVNTGVAVKIPYNTIDWPAGTKFLQVACGYNYTVCLADNYSVMIFGRNLNKQLDNNTTSNVVQPTKLLTVGNITSVACGYQHTLLFNYTNIDDLERIYTFGNNSKNQLGRISPSTESYIADASMPNYDAVDKYKIYNVVQMSCGYNHSLILFDSGHVYGFGDNSKGQLGLLPSTVDSLTIIPNLVNIVNISCVQDSSFAVSYDGTVFAFGNNSDGRVEVFDALGTRSSPLTVLPNITDTTTKVANINGAYYASGWQESTDYYLMDSVQNNGVIIKGVDLLTCGSNNNGQIGKDTISANNVSTYVPMTNTTFINKKVRQISCGMSFLYILVGDDYSVSNGTVFSCGFNNMGMLGHGEFTDKNTFTEVTALSGQNISQISCGYDHVLFLDTDGNVKGVGANDHGQLGPVKTPGEYYYKTPENLSNPSDTANPLKKVVQISAGYGFSVVITATQVISFGRNTHGQLGKGNYIDSFAYNIVGFSGSIAPKQAKCGANHSIVLMQNGDLYAFGNNSKGQFGNDSYVSSNVPTKITFTPSIGQIKQISCGIMHTLVSTNDNKVYFWGDNNNGQSFDSDLNKKTFNKPNIFRDFSTAPASIQTTLRAFGNTSHALFIDNNTSTYMFIFSGCNFNGRAGTGTVGKYHAGTLNDTIILIPETLKMEQSSTLPGNDSTRATKCGLVGYYNRYVTANDLNDLMANENTQAITKIYAQT